MSVRDILNLTLFFCYFKTYARHHFELNNLKSNMSRSFLLTILFGLCFAITAQAQRSATVKGGLIGLDYVRDGQTNMIMGYFGGLDARLGAYDNSYILLGVVLGRMHSKYKDEYLQEENLFKVKNGIDFGRIKAGIEGRLFENSKNFNIRWNGAVAINILLQDLGEEITDFESVSFNIPLGVGFDFGPLSLDLTYEPGISNWIIDNDNSKPRIGTVALGLSF